MCEYPAITAFLENMKERNIALSSIKVYRYELIRFMKYLSNKGVQNYAISDLRTLPLSIFREYVETRKKQNASLNTVRHVARVIALFGRFVGIDDELVLLPEETPTERIMKPSDFATDKDFKKLIKVMPTDFGLTADHEVSRRYITDRNLSIVHLMRWYGLTMKEVCGINMRDIDFANNTLALPPPTTKPREIKLRLTHKRLIYKYYTTIPDLFRPRIDSQHPLFVSFLHVKGTYKWDYEKDEPKRITPRGIQPIIKKEVDRAGVKNISARTLRNRCILDHLLKERSEWRILLYFGFKSSLSLRPYKRYIEALKSEEKGIGKEIEVF